MANVKYHRCFPTTIGQFRYNPVDFDEKNMVEYIVKTKKKHRYHTKDDLHNILFFVPLRDALIHVCKNYMDDLKYQYENLEITGMWANRLYDGDIHPPHTHSNNFLSGVYYLKASNKSAPIQFFDPRAQATVLRPRNTPTWENSSMVQFDAIEKMGYIFPSWLMHWVPQTLDERISISWNILVRGNYGEPDTLQNAHI